MTTAEAKRMFEDLVARYGFRYAEQTKQYMGIHEGVGFDVSYFHNCLRLIALAPDAAINDQILENFSGFTHVKQSGVLTSWINGVRAKSGNHPNQVEIELTPNRLKQLTEQQVLDLPANLVQDFRQFGAKPAIAACGLCHAVPPNTLMTIDDYYVTACGDCFARIRDEAAVGHLERTAPVRWVPALLTLLVGAAFYALIWGGIQQTAMPGKILLFVPFIAAVMLSAMVDSAAEGTSLLLRLITAATIIAAVFAGNVWGTKTLIEKHIQDVISWQEAFRYYFEVRLPQHQQEGFFLIGGFAGAWVGSRSSKLLTKVRIG